MVVDRLFLQTFIASHMELMHLFYIIDTAISVIVCYKLPILLATTVHSEIGVKGVHKNWFDARALFHSSSRRRCSPLIANYYAVTRDAFIQRKSVGLCLSNAVFMLAQAALQPHFVVSFFGFHMLPRAPWLLVRDIEFVRC